MSIKKVLVVYAQALLIHTISTQYLGATDNYGYVVSWAVNPVTAIPSTYAIAPIAEWLHAPAAVSGSSGSGYTVYSASPTIPTGVNFVLSNAYVGEVIVADEVRTDAVTIVEGEIELFGSTALEAVLPLTVPGATAYCCDEVSAITCEDICASGFTDMAEILHCWTIAKPVVYGSGIGYGPHGYTQL